MFLDLRHILNISWAYFWRISLSKSLAYLGISRLLIEHLFGISYLYIGHILGLSLAYLVNDLGYLWNMFLLYCSYFLCVLHRPLAPLNSCSSKADHACMSSQISHFTYRVFFLSGPNIIWQSRLRLSKIRGGKKKNTLYLHDTGRCIYKHLFGFA